VSRTLLVVATLGALAAPALADPVVEKSRVEVKPAAAPFKQLSIENPLGDVRVEGYDGTAIMIETHKRAPDDEALDRLRVSLVPSTDGTVRITTTADKGEGKKVVRGLVAIDVIIRAPRNARIDAVVGTGKLEVLNMDGGGELESASGMIRVRNVQGELYTHSVSGQLSLSQVFGSLDASTVSSDLDLDSIQGQKVFASANHGKIAGRRVRAREIELTTMKGDIMLEAEASLHGRVVVSSLYGDVDVKLRRAGAVLVRGRGTKIDLGMATQQQPSGWSQATIGQGEDPAIIELRSQHGVVRFAVIQ
jgi:DUF4097 and DUF4098 domain-containing protein YvlB